jgi:hypothetical protein
MPSPRPPARARVLKSGIVIAVLALVALLSWSVSSPAGSSPDENFHATSIWCGWGSDDTNCRDEGVKDTRSMPFDPVNASCYSGLPGISGECQKEFSGGDKRWDATWGNFVDLYPPVYYAAMHPLVGEDYDDSILRIRIVNCLLIVSLVGALALLVPASLRRTMLWSFLISVVPLGMFILASVNPSSWSVLSAGTLWVALYAQFDATGRRRVALGAFAGLMALMGSGARGDSCLYSSLAVVAVFTLRWGALRRNRGPVLVGLFVIVMSAAFFLSSGQSDIASKGLTVPDEMLSNASKPEIAIRNFLNVPYVLTGMFGSWPLGWFDTEIPPIVIQSAMFAFVCLTFAGLAHLTRAKAVALSGVAVCFVLFPIVILTQGRQFVGLSVQPRYLLPLLVLMAAMSLHSARPGDEVRLNRFQIALIASGLSVANAVALHVNMRRYVTGIDVNGIDLSAGREWWWDIPVGPMTTWIVGSLAFAGACVLILTLPTVTTAAPAAGRSATHRLRTSPERPDEELPTGRSSVPDASDRVHDDETLPR